MHDIDRQLQHMLQGEFDQGWTISEKLQQQGMENIELVEDKTPEEMWSRHQFNRGWYLLNQGDYRQGSMCLELGRQLNVYGGSVLKTNAPIYNPDIHDIRGKNIIISLEGGFGDEIIHARFCNSFKALGADQVIIAASPELVSVFSRIDGCDQVITRDQTNLVSHDFWVPGFSAGWIAGHDYSTLPNDPYLVVNLESSTIWKSIITSEKKRVGIRWAGNPKFEHQQFRRFPVEFMFELAKYDNVQLYSLQRDANIEVLPDNIIDLQHLMLSWEDTLAAIDNLDLVITSCTSIAHAAAAMGKETWVLVPILPYHVWAKGAPETTTTPYYQTVKLYRQSEYQNWNNTFLNLYRDFEEKFNLPPQEHTMQLLPMKKINIGSGFTKLPGFINVDNSEICEPDQLVDLEQVPWPWQDNEFSHLVAKDVLEHLGNTPREFINILKEMYRISNNGAVWEIQVPHWRSDHAFDDPTHQRSLSPESFILFDRKEMYSRRKQNMSCSPLAFEHNIDIEVCDVKYNYTSLFKEKLRNKEISENDFKVMFNTMNNVAESTIMLLQVHKPGRYTVEDIKNLNK